MLGVLPTNWYSIQAGDIYGLRLEYDDNTQKTHRAIVIRRYMACRVDGMEFCPGKGDFIII